MRNGDKQKVSVIIAVHDGEPYIKESLDSALGQSYGDIEVVVVDDGSGDSTGDLLKAVSERDQRVKVVSNPGRKGIAFSRNAGISVSTGRYIAVLDSDDRALPERIKRQVDFLERNPSIDGVGSEFTYIDETGKKIEVLKPPVKSRVSAEDILDDPMCLVHGTLTAKRECFEACGGYREEFDRAVDYDLLLRMTETFKLANLEEPQTEVRISLSSGTFRYRSAQIRYAEIARKLAVQRRTRGSDIIQRNEKQAFLRLKKKIFGSKELTSRIEVSSNYRYWAHRMYHRGPIGYSRRLVLAALGQCPFNIKAWGFMVFLFSPVWIRRTLTRVKRRFVR
ncbi:MAG: glycosyltransferase [Candidatus Omnitrophica bacterium]|nr:glycosyltransferase [Candidatus Omnitrophota bacterium]